MLQGEREGLSTNFDASHFFGDAGFFGDLGDDGALEGALEVGGSPKRRIRLAVLHYLPANTPASPAAAPGT